MRPRLSLPAEANLADDQDPMLGLAARSAAFQLVAIAKLAGHQPSSGFAEPRPKLPRKGTAP